MHVFLLYPELLGILCSYLGIKNPVKTFIRFVISSFLPWYWNGVSQLNFTLWNFSENCRFFVQSCLKLFCFFPRFAHIVLDGTLSSWYISVAHLEISLEISMVCQKIYWGSSLTHLLVHITESYRNNGRT